MKDLNKIANIGYVEDHLSRRNRLGGYEDNFWYSPYHYLRIRKHKNLNDKYYDETLYHPHWSKP